MANTKAAKKRTRQSLERRARNVHVKATVRGGMRNFLDACAAADLGKAGDALRQAVRLIDKAVSKGVLHRNTAARRKSRLAKMLAAKKQAAEQS